VLFSDGNSLIAYSTLRTVLWGIGGEIPPIYPARGREASSTRQV
jgi:hypothetical protein